VCVSQITDVEIDKVNKPYLPIPAGNLSPRAAKATVTLCLLAGVALGLAPSALGSPGLAVGGRRWLVGSFLPLRVVGVESAVSLFVRALLSRPSRAALEEPNMRAETSLF
ncbi:unnamed protein product, partial [Scytosiphon promiscuus]